jgi:S1-C subfamily serine protease
MDTNHGTGEPAGTTEPLDAWAPPVPGTSYATVGAPVTAPPVEPVGDPWTSPLWGRPDTVGGYWSAPDATERIVVPPAGPAPVARKRASRGLVAAVATVIIAMLIGFGAVKAIPHDDSASVASPPTSSAPATQPTDPAQTDPSQDDPLQGLLPTEDPQTQPSQGTGSSGSSSTADPAVVAAVSPSIVNITTTIGYDGNQAAGTGEVMTEDGYVLTNHHVIAGSTSIKVAVAGTTKSYDADVVGYDASRDIAVIKLRNASGMTPAPFGDSSTVKVGDTVIGMGNAGGAGGKPIVAAGKVTGLDKSITAMDSENGTSEQLEGLIETDAQIQPGDSGGSLVSSDAKVIGIITAGSVSASPTGKQQTTDGYAIPINEALAIAQDIRDGKASDTVHIGASAFLGIKVASAGSSTGGVTVSGVVSGSAAAKAGITAGSTITAIDGTKVTSNTALRAAIAPHHPGDTVSISWTTAAGKSRTAQVTFGNGPVA